MCITELSTVPYASNTFLFSVDRRVTALCKVLIELQEASSVDLLQSTSVLFWAKFVLIC